VKRRNGQKVSSVVRTAALQARPPALGAWKLELLARPAALRSPACGAQSQESRENSPARRAKSPGIRAPSPVDEAFCSDSEAQNPDGRDQSLARRAWRAVFLADFMGFVVWSPERQISEHSGWMRDITRGMCVRKPNHQRGNETMFSFLVHDTESPYVDNRPPGPASETRECQNGRAPTPDARFTRHCAKSSPPLPTSPTSLPAMALSSP